MNLRFLPCEDGLDVMLGSLYVIRHRASCPAVAIARGEAAVTMVRGNFRLDDTVTAAAELAVSVVSGTRAEFLGDGEVVARL